MNDTCFRLLTAAELDRLYETDMTRDFPADELKPLSCLQTLLAKGNYEPYGLFYGETLLAYALYWRAAGEPYRMLDYFAVLPEGRNKGLGGKLLKEMLERFCGEEQGVFLEVEIPNTGDEAVDSLRRRRLGFYRRAGLRQMGYTTRIFGVPFLVLAYGSEISDEALMETHRKIYRTAFSGAVYERQVLIPAEGGGQA
ncbi:MAG: GNAT family N-acetyltransferase [Oscillospiraceae bacterium]|nr:GNAT family N-acetyltransferase [Oscillospiraceae bacterium]